MKETLDKSFLCRWHVAVMELQGSTCFWWLPVYCCVQTVVWVSLELTLLTLD